MTSTHLIEKAESYLGNLCLDIPCRRVGSAGNRAATDLFAKIVASCGYETHSPEFNCMDWSQEGADLYVDGDAFEVIPSPYSLGCNVRAPLSIISSDEELEAATVSNQILLLRGEAAREQLMPKKFPFYNPDRHKRVIQLLETRHPQAIIAATSRDPEMVVGSQHPFPLIEDGDFDIPSVYMTEEEGLRLAEYAGRQVALEIRANRIPSTGCNIIARKGAAGERRVVLFAHIDARLDSPGANDNASGVAILLLLAELMADYSGKLGLEIVALNGEDYYSNPGEQQYLALNVGRFGEILLGINLDGAGYYRGDIAYSTYGCPVEVAAAIRRVFSAYSGLVEGEPWYQGDHGLFLMNEVPALAITSQRLAELMAGIIHTPKDKPETVDATKLATVALALQDLLYHLELST